MKYYYPETIAKASIIKAEIASRLRMVFGSTISDLDAVIFADLIDKLIDVKLSDDEHNPMNFEDLD